MLTAFAVLCLIALDWTFGAIDSRHQWSKHNGG